MSPLLVVLVALSAASCHASPHSHGVLGAKKFADVDDCNGAIAFSSVGAPETAKGSKLSFNSALIDKGIGWSRENGEFTCHCPGLYQFSFAASGDEETRLSLKKQESQDEGWSTVIATGPGGGSSVALLEMDVGDKTAIWLDSGKLHQETDKSPISAFSGFRIAKK